MNSTLKKTLLCVVASAVVLTAVVPTHKGLRAAEETTQPGTTAGQSQYVEPDNEKMLQAKIDEAKKMGVQVTTSEEEIAPIVRTETEKVDQAKKELEKYNAAEIKKLETAIDEQKKINQENLKKLQDAFKLILGDEWKVDDFAQFALPQKDNVDTLSEDAKLYKLLEKMASISIVNRDPNLGSALNVDKSKCQKKDYVSSGDYFLYENMFRDNLSGNTVDLKVTVENVIGKDLDGSVRSKMKEYLRDKEFDPEQPHFYVEAAHLQVKVDFLKHGTDEPIEIEPIVAFSDVDAGQGVQINEGVKVLSVLKGSRISEKKDPYRNSADVGKSADGNIYSGPQAGTEETDKSCWILFHLDKTATFTYTYFNPTPAGHILGGQGLTYNKPKLGENQQVTIKLKKQPLTDPTPSVPDIQVPNKVPNQYFERMGGQKSHSSSRSKETTVALPTRQKDVVPNTAANKRSCPFQRKGLSDRRARNLLIESQ